LIQLSNLKKKSTGKSRNRMGHVFSFAQKVVRIGAEIELVNLESNAHLSVL
jgi:hypothetical protein